MSFLLGLLILIGDIYAIIQIINAREKDGNKVIWVLVVFLLPFIGLVLWWFMGPGKKK